MATKIELIVRITDDVEGVAEVATGVTGRDLQSTQDAFSDLVFYRGTSFAESALENPVFEKTPEAKKPAGTPVVESKRGRAKT